MCCSEALYRCGNSYFCEAHHDGQKRHVAEPCLGPGKCPLGVPHPPNSMDPYKSMYPLGCSLCRKANAITAAAMIEEFKLEEEKKPVFDKKLQE